MQLKWLRYLWEWLSLPGFPSVWTWHKVNMTELRIYANHFVGVHPLVRALETSQPFVLHTIQCSKLWFNTCLISFLKIMIWLLFFYCFDFLFWLKLWSNRWIFVLKLAFCMRTHSSFNMFLATSSNSFCSTPIAEEYYIWNPFSKCFSRLNSRTKLALNFHSRSGWATLTLHSWLWLDEAEALKNLHIAAVTYTSLCTHRSVKNPTEVGHCYSLYSNLLDWFIYMSITKPN